MLAAGNFPWLKCKHFSSVVRLLAVRLLPNKKGGKSLYAQSREILSHMGYNDVCEYSKHVQYIYVYVIGYVGM